MPRSPLNLYNQKLKSGELHHDGAQVRAVQVLNHLYGFIRERVERQDFSSKALEFLKAKVGMKTEPLRGVYMYGGVGRGKSMLMDLFYEALPVSVSRRRVHFHEFMIETHGYLHERRQEGEAADGTDGALMAYAEHIAQESHVLCFDEFHVTDVADAMILGRLFTALFARGVIVVSTSNWVPDELYKGGLQRELFLPFIALLQERMQVVHLDSVVDYRMKFEGGSERYFTPANEKTQRKMDDLFTEMSGGAKVKSETLKVKGRVIEVSQVAKGVARFTFQQLCEQPYGAEDYLKIAQRYDTVFLENIRKMGYDRRNEAKRLMILIDALYESGTKLVISAATTPDKLYYGHDHAFEFDRTISRLVEMQSEAYNKAA